MNDARSGAMERAFDLPVLRITDCMGCSVMHTTQNQLRDTGC